MADDPVDFTFLVTAGGLVDLLLVLILVITPDSHMHIPQQMVIPLVLNKQRSFY